MDSRQICSHSTQSPCGCCCCSFFGFVFWLFVFSLTGPRAAEASRSPSVLHLRTPGSLAKQPAGVSVSSPTADDICLLAAADQDSRTPCGRGKLRLRNFARFGRHEDKEKHHTSSAGESGRTLRQEKEAYCSLISPFIHCSRPWMFM